MSNNNAITRPELVQMIGDVIIQLDELRSNFDRETRQRIQLDTFRDQLDNAQLHLVRMTISENNAAFVEATKALEATSETLGQTITDVERVANTLETLVKFVAVVEKIAELAP